MSIAIQQFFSYIWSSIQLVSAIVCASRESNNVTVFALNPFLFRRSVIFFPFFFLRTFAGSGKIVRPTTEEMFFLPQRPYCTLGPLRDQINYPSSHSDTAGVAAEADGDHATLTPTTATTTMAGETKLSSSGKSSTAGKGLDGEHGVFDAGHRDEDEELLSLLRKVLSGPRIQAA